MSRTLAVTSAGGESVQAIDRVMAILEVVTQQPTGATASEVATQAELSMSTATRLLHQLAERNLVARADGDRRYTLGPRLFGLVRGAAAQPELSALSRPVLRRVRDVTGETASLHVRRGHSRICVAALPSTQPVARHVPIGTAMPLHRNATGEVLLAGAPPADRARYLAGLDLAAREQVALQRRIDLILAQGWAMVVDDWVPGVTGISAAVVDGETTIAALSVSGPASRFDAAAAKSHVPTILEAAAELSQWGAAAIR